MMFFANFDRIWTYLLATGLKEKPNDKVIDKFNYKRIFFVMLREIFVCGNS